MDASTFTHARRKVISPSVQLSVMRSTITVARLAARTQTLSHVPWVMSSILMIMYALWLLIVLRRKAIGSLHAGVVTHASSRRLMGGVTVALLEDMYPVLLRVVIHPSCRRPMGY